MPFIIYCTSGIVRVRTIRLWYILARCWNHSSIGIYHQRPSYYHSASSLFFARTKQSPCTAQIFLQQPFNTFGYWYITIFISLSLSRLSMFDILQHS